MNTVEMLVSRGRLTSIANINIDNSQHDHR